MSKEKKSKIRPVLVVINIILLAAIAWVLLNKYYSRSLQFNLRYGEKPVKLLEIMDKYFLNTIEKSVSLVYIFNEMPKLNDIAALEKLFRKHRDVANFSVFFHKKFRSDINLDFPHRFLTHIKLLAKTENDLLETNYLIVLQDRATKFFDTSLKIRNTNMIIEKYVNPGKEFNDFTFSSKRLKDKLIENLKEGEKTLYNLVNDEIETFTDFTGYSRVYFIVAECSACELKRLFQRMNTGQIFNDANNLVIFPMHALESELKTIIDGEGIQLPVYIDHLDQFGLLSVISGIKENLIMIEKKDMEE